MRITSSSFGCAQDDEATGTLSPMATLPDEGVAEKIAKELCALSLFGDDTLAQLARDLAAGDVSAAGWRALIEQALRARPDTAQEQDAESH